LSDKNLSRPILLIILLAYIALGFAYAKMTPLWQVPDEPAHFNYVGYIAEENGLPVLQTGDYPQAYLEEIKAGHFPADMSIAPIRYESHQPPLYYLTASVLYRALSGLPLPTQVLGLRLLSVFFGVAILLMAYLTVREIFPNDPYLVLGTTAFIAFVPMHIAMTAGINNDALAELILACTLWQLVRFLKADFDSKRSILLGITIGLGLLTKTTTYVSLPLAIIVVLSMAYREGGSSSQVSWKRIAVRSALILGPALLVTLPWLLRNVAIYGPTDPLGWQRHDEVVAGQLTTTDFLSQVGLLQYLRAFLYTTFQSFWAQFGWMGVLVDQRIYLTLALLCIYVALGLALFVVRLRQAAHRFTRFQEQALVLLAGSAFLTLCTYLWYNTKFVQHQGRYLFPAMIPMGLFFALGLRELLIDHWARALVPISALGASTAVLLYFSCPQFGRLPTALGVIIFVYYVARRFLPKWIAVIVPPLVHASLFGLAIVCLWGFIIPYFR
jgi:4-amino-4-deoxy-L-arabinose transferase-like glycosyltransferase